MRALPPILALAAAAVAVPASAEQRTLSVSSFERIRVDGPFEVSVATGGSPGARVEGDGDALDRMQLAVDGRTLTIRRRTDGVWGERGTKPIAGIVRIRLTTPSLATVMVGGDARVGVDRMKAQRVELWVTGAGTIDLAAADADQLNAQLIGTGRLTIGGRAATARLMTNGPGAIDAAALDAGDLVVRLEGPGETLAKARFSATVTSTGLGSVKVAGQPKCTVRAPSGAPIVCGLPTP